MKNALTKKFAERFSFADEAKLIDTLKATAFKVKDGVVSDEQMMALLIVADQYDLNPFTREIFAFPDKQNGIVPVVSVDGWTRIINQHEAFDGLEFIFADENVVLPGAKPCPASIECIIYRKDRSHPIRVPEYLDEVYREAFSGQNNGRAYTVNGPWQSHTKRMLRHKGLIQCARIAFGFAGIYDIDEAERIIENQVEVLNAIPQEPSDNTKRMTLKLIERAEKAGAWQAALDYARENFAGFDLHYVQEAINQAKAKSAVNQSLPEAYTLTQAVVTPDHTDQTATDALPVNKQRRTSPLAEIKAALA